MFYQSSFVSIFFTILFLCLVFIDVECSHDHFVSKRMPVSTRSQSRHSQSISKDLSTVALLKPGQAVSEVSLIAVSSSSLNISCKTELSLECTSSSLFNRDSKPHGSSLEPSDNLKFGILEFSNGTSQRDLKLLDHNFSLSATVNMEADCKDSTTMATKSKNITDMNALFEALSAKLTSETTKISQDFQSVAEAHNDFKQEVRNEIDEL
jgi:hypothetical protein